MLSHCERCAPVLIHSYTEMPGISSRWLGVPAADRYIPPPFRETRRFQSPRADRGPWGDKGRAVNRSRPLVQCAFHPDMKRVCPFDHALPQGGPANTHRFSIACLQTQGALADGLEDRQGGAGHPLCTSAPVRASQRLPAARRPERLDGTGESVQRKDGGNRRGVIRLRLGEEELRLHHLLQKRDGRLRVEGGDVTS